MKVKDLMARLAEVNPDDEVVLASDAEGNSFSLLCQTEDLMAFHKGEVGLRELTPELAKIGYSKEDVIEGMSCVILYP